MFFFFWVFLFFCFNLFCSEAMRGNSPTDGGGRNDALRALSLKGVARSPFLSLAGEGGQDCGGRLPVDPGRAADEVRAGERNWLAF